jgi:hypothetical protein
MRLYTTLFALVAVGCSSGSSSDPFGPDPDYAAIDQRFASPDGTLTNGNAGSVFSRYSDDKQTSQDIDVSGAAGASSSSSSSSSVHSQSLRVLDLAQSGGSTSCSALEHGDTTGSCACADGGSFSYDFSGVRELQSSSGPIDVSLKMRFSSCVSKGIAIDGREFLRLHADRGGTGKVDENSVGMTLIADITATKGTETHHIDLAARLSKGDVEIAVQVDDGWITIRSDGDGYVVRDRNGTWRCHAGTCASSTGDTRKY